MECSTFCCLRMNQVLMILLLFLWDRRLVLEDPSPSWLDHRLVLGVLLQVHLLEIQGKR